MWLIDADALLKSIWDEQAYKDSFAYRMVAYKIASATTIEAEPVRHGRWVNPHINKYGHPCHHCSKCDFLASQKDRNFCPNCGAKMDGGTSDGHEQG